MTRQVWTTRAHTCTHTHYPVSCILLLPFRSELNQPFLRNGRGELGTAGEYYELMRTWGKGRGRERRLKQPCRALLRVWHGLSTTLTCRSQHLTGKGSPWRPCGTNLLEEACGAGVRETEVVSESQETGLYCKAAHSPSKRFVNLNQSLLQFTLSNIQRIRSSTRLSKGNQVNCSLVSMHRNVIDLKTSEQFWLSNINLHFVSPLHVKHMCCVLSHFSSSQLFATLWTAAL